MYSELCDLPNRFVRYAESVVTGGFVLVYIYGRITDEGYASRSPLSDPVQALFPKNSGRRVDVLRMHYAKGRLPNKNKGFPCSSRKHSNKDFRHKRLITLAPWHLAVRFVNPTLSCLQEQSVFTGNWSNNLCHCTNLTSLFVQRISLQKTLAWMTGLSYSAP